MVNIINTLDSYGEKKLPQKIGYAITRNLMTLSTDYKYYTDELNKLFKKYEDYMVKDNDNNVIYNDIGIPIIEKEKSKDYEEELTDLLNIEIEVNIYTIPIDVFNYADNVGKYDSLSAKDIMNLQSILCDNKIEK